MEAIQQITFTEALTGIGIAVMLIAVLVFIMVRTSLSLMQSGEDERKPLLNVVIFGFAILLGVFVCDKVIALHTDILSKEESISVFNLIKDISLIVFGYYFGVSNGKNKG